MPGAQRALAFHGAGGPCTSGLGGEHRDGHCPPRWAWEGSWRHEGVSPHGQLGVDMASVRFSVQFLRAKPKGTPKLWSSPHVVCITPLPHFSQPLTIPSFQAMQSRDLPLTAPRAPTGPSHAPHFLFSFCSVILPPSRRSSG